MENVFRTRSETANKVYRNFRSGLDNFPILFGFDVSKGISCSESSVAETLNEIFIFEVFGFSTDGPSVIGGPPVGKPPRNLIFPHRWPLVVHRWPVVGYHGCQYGNDFCVPESSLQSYGKTTKNKIYKSFKNS